MGLVSVDSGWERRIMRQGLETDKMRRRAHTRVGLDSIVDGEAVIMSQDIPLYPFPDGIVSQKSFFF